MRKTSSSILPDTPSAPVRGKSETAPRGTACRLTAAVLCMIFMCALLPSCGKNGSALPAAVEYFRYPAVRWTAKRRRWRRTPMKNRTTAETSNPAQTRTKQTRTKRTRTKRTRTKRTCLKQTLPTLRRKKSTPTATPLQLLTHCSCILPCRAQERRFIMRISKAACPIPTTQTK